MTSKPQKTFKATALLLVLSLLQVYIIGAAAAVPQFDQIQGSLTTRDSKPITVNGNPSTSGQTILSGATIDTPSGVGATVNLSPLGSVDLAPGARIELTFGDGQIKVRLIEGCAVVRANQGTYAEINNSTEKLTSNDADKKQAATLDVCSPTGGAAPLINQGAAASAGAGASEAAVAVATVGGGAATAGGVGAGVIIGGIGLGSLMALAIIVPCRRGRNPSPGEPRGRNDECRD
jgi:hypothetical protein